MGRRSAKGRRPGLGADGKDGDTYDPLTGAHRQYMRDGTPRSSRPLAAASGRLESAASVAVRPADLDLRISRRLLIAPLTACARMNRWQARHPQCCRAPFGRPGPHEARASLGLRLASSQRLAMKPIIALLAACAMTGCATDAPADPGGLIGMTEQQVRQALAARGLIDVSRVNPPARSGKPPYLMRSAAS